MTKDIKDKKQKNNYVYKLGQIKGNLKLPIIIKANEAQIIAMKVEDIESPKPLLQDVVKNLTENIGVDLQQVYISHIVEGVFYSKSIFSNFMEKETFDEVMSIIVNKLKYRKR